MTMRLSAFPTAQDRAWAWFCTGGAWLLSALFVAAAFMLPTAPVIAAVLLVMLLPTAGALPLSYNALTPEGLCLKQGLHFRTLIPWSEIRLAEPEAKRYWHFGPGVKVAGRHDLFVAMSGCNLVRVELKAPRRFTLYGLIPFVTTQRLFFNAADPAAIAAEINRRLA